MPSRRHVARDITYAHSAATKSGRAMIRIMENATGRLRMIKRADGYAVSRRLKWGGARQTF